MGRQIVIRCKTKAGQHTLKDLTTESTLIELKAQVMSLTGLEYNEISLRSGFPPKPISSDDGSTLPECGVLHGDTIIVEDISFTDKPTTHVSKRSLSPTRQAPENSLPAIKRRQSQITNSDCTIKRKIVPANNSCLFASIYYCLNDGKTSCFADTQKLRRIVADCILTDETTYSEALLGRTPMDYIAWIQKQESWGGGIELAILSKHYNVEMDVVDVKNTRIEKFNEGSSRRILMIYDGIHYDPLYEVNHLDKVRTTFSLSDDTVLAKALTLAESEKSNRQFTDANNFKLKCLGCQKGFVGAKEASDHAKETSHTNFGEY